MACVHETSEAPSRGEYDYCVDTNNVAAPAPVMTTKPIEWDSLSTLVTVVGKPVETKAPLVEADMGYLEFSTTTEGLALNIMGKALQEHVREQARDIIYPENNEEDSFRFVKMEPTLLCFTKGFDNVDADAAAESSSSLQKIPLFPVRAPPFRNITKLVYLPSVPHSSLQMEAFPS
jgi:hypothetical protein